MSRKKTRETEIGGVLRFLQTLVIILAVGLGITVAVGLRSILGPQGSFTSWLVPIVFAAVLTAVMAGLWHVTLGMAARVNPRDAKQVWTVIAFALALTAVHGATSMPFLASAIGGSDAVKYHQEQTLSQLSVAADQIAASSTARERVSAGISRETGSLSRLLDEEVSGLGISRTPGFGPIAEDVQAALRALRDYGTSFRGQSINLASQQSVARNLIARAKDASNIGDETAFAENVGAARTLLSPLANQSGTGLDLSYDFSASSIQGVRSVTPRLNALVSFGPASGERIVLPVYQPISHPVAVLTYPEAVPLAWSVAITVDLLPLTAALLTLGLAINSARRRQ